MTRRRKSIASNYFTTTPIPTLSANDQARMEFSSWQAFIARVEACEIEPWLRDKLTDNLKFRHVNTIQEAFELARSGWTDKVDEARQVSNPLFTRIASKIERQDPVYDLIGSQIDIAAFVDGQPECWQRMEPTTVDGASSRIIRLAYNAFSSASVRTEALIKRGSAISSLVELLEFAGYRVEIWLVCGVHHDHTKNIKADFELSVLIKQADQPIDMARLLMALAHPATTRVLERILQTSIPEPVRIATKCSQNTPIDRRTFGACSDSLFASQYDVYVQSMDSVEEERWNDENFAVNYMIETLKTQGVELTD